MRNFTLLRTMLLTAICTLVSVSVNAQGVLFKGNNGIIIANTKVFTMVRPNDQVLWSDDPSVKIRQQPNAKAKVVGDICFFEGLSNAVLQAEPKEKWVRVGGHKYSGYSNSHYLQNMTWYTGTGEYVLVADGLAPIYVESMADPEEANQYSNALCYVRKGTIIADQFKETAHDYILETIHTNLIVPKYLVTKRRK